MTDAEQGADPTPRLGARVTRRKPDVLLLLTVGTLMVVGGLIGGLFAKASAEKAASGSPMPTLPVHVYAQYTAHSIVPDYTGLGIGNLVAVLGLIIVVVCVIVASRRRRSA